MANYEAVTVTNYFQVSDIGKAREVAEKLGLEFYINATTNECSFASYDSCGSIDEVWDEYSDDTSSIGEVLQSILVSDAVIITEVGNEKLRYVGGHGTIITKDKIDYVSLETALQDKLTEMLAS